MNCRSTNDLYLILLFSRSQYFIKTAEECDLCVAVKYMYVAFFPSSVYIHDNNNDNINVVLL